MATNLVAQRIDRFKERIQSPAFRDEVAQALPAHVRPERFQRVLLTSVINDNRLLDVQPSKVIKAALKIAPLGLFTDPLLGEAALVVDGKQDVQVRVMYRGLMKLAKQSDEIAAIYAHDICAKDKVKVSLGTEKKLEHEPAEGDRGEPNRYYAVVRYKSGEVDFEVMTVDEINRIRDRSDAWKAFKAQKIKSTPWSTDPGEMSKKTVLRRLLKRVPASPDLADALRIEEEADQRDYGGRVQHAPAPMDDEPEYVELIDQHGEAFMVPAENVGAWARERAGECVSLEELDELATNNLGMETQAVRDAAQVERENRIARQPAQEARQTPPADPASTAPSDGSLPLDAPEAAAVSTIPITWPEAKSTIYLSPANAKAAYKMKAETKSPKWREECLAANPELARLVEARQP